MLIISVLFYIKQQKASIILKPFFILNSERLECELLPIIL